MKRKRMKNKKMNQEEPKEQITSILQKGESYLMIITEPYYSRSYSDGCQRYSKIEETKSNGVKPTVGTSR